MSSWKVPATPQVLLVFENWWRILKSLGGLWVRERCVWRLERLFSRDGRKA